MPNSENPNFTSKQTCMKHQILLSGFFSKIIGYFLLAAMFFAFNGCQSEASQTNSEVIEIVFAGGVDDGGTVQPLIDKFNEEHKGNIQVIWKQGARTTDELYKEIVADFENGSIDVAGTDVIWTPAIATQGLVEDISNLFFESHEPNEFIEAALESVSYQFKIWGVPWFTDAGILYYRKDLLKQNGLDYPPATWDELIEFSKHVMRNSDTKYGYVFQGAAYEGGVTNACEFIWNAEGNILFGDLPISADFDVAGFDSDIIAVDSEKAKRGLKEIEKLKDSGIIPVNISEFKEREAAEVFQNGDAVFMRSWAGAYGFFINSDAKVNAENVGLAPLPTSDRNMTAYSCLGGWNLMISAKSSEAKKKAAWEFIKFMTSAESQKFRASNGGILPSLRSLYTDEQFLAEAPIVSFARQVMPISKERPRSPYYMEISAEIATAYAQLLNGEITSDEAVKVMSNKMEMILKKDLGKEG